jgi:hypothetical protein
MAKKAYEESNIANIAVAIREKTGGNQTYKTSEMPSGVNEVFDKGYTNGYNEGYTKGDSEGYDKGYDTGYEEGFNSAPPDYLLYTYSQPVFRNTIFPEGKKDVVLNMPMLENLLGSGMFNNTNATSITINAENLKKLQLMRQFESNKYVKFIDLSKVGNGSVNLVNSAENGFNNCVSLEAVVGNLDFSNVTAAPNIFTNCHVLREVRITPLTIKINFPLDYAANLSPESVQSFIDGLADLTGQTAKTIYWHSTVLAKLTPAQYAQIGSKNWIAR